MGPSATVCGPVQVSMGPSATVCGSVQVSMGLRPRPFIRAELSDVDRRLISTNVNTASSYQKNVYCRDSIF